MSQSSLLQQAIWWHIYPLGALDAPIFEGRTPGVTHRLPRLTRWIDYVVELGCSGFLMGPIFESTSHGYDTLNHFKIDKRLGDEADFVDFIAESKRRGLSVVLDGVFNHVGNKHDLVLKAREAGTGLVLMQGEGESRSHKPWEGHSELALLDHKHEAVEDLVVKVMEFWLKRGICGWRLDVAYAVPPQFWKKVISRVRSNFPDAIFIGEIIHGDYLALACNSSLDSFTQYELWKGIWSSINDRNFWEMAWALERHNSFSAELIPQTFIGNHDVTRIASQLGDAGAALAAIFLFTLPGSPSIYYGDEQAFRGIKVSGRDADTPLRPALPDDPAKLASSGWWLYRLHQNLIGIRRRNSWITTATVSVLDKDCTWINYQVSNADHRLEVRITLEPVPSAELLVNGEHAFRWQADH